jgi:hypothetical protein
MGAREAIVVCDHSLAKWHTLKPCVLPSKIEVKISKLPAIVTGTAPVV